MRNVTGIFVMHDSSKVGRVWDWSNDSNESSPSPMHRHRLYEALLLIPRTSFFQLFHIILIAIRKSSVPTSP